MGETYNYNNHNYLLKKGTHEAHIKAELRFSVEARNELVTTNETGTNT